MPENKNKLLQLVPQRNPAETIKTKNVDSKYVKTVLSPLISKQTASLNITLVKQLSAYPNYGNPVKSADILYTGNKGAWDIDVPEFLLVSGSLKGRLIIRAALDDHVGVAASRYGARIYINGSLVHRGRLPLEHGAPVGGIFTNWKELSFNLHNLQKENKIVIENFSDCGIKDWIGFDRMELRLFQT